VSRAFPSWKRSILTEIHLCHACSDHETEDGNARAGIELGKLDSAVDKVLDTISHRYPNLEIPIHSRMRHFESGNVNRMRDLELGWSRGE
jgi:hypothetical protein